jgi:phosphoglucosamine mutase
MRSKTFFGTDGIRGIYGQYPLTPQGMWALGLGLGRWILEQGNVVQPFVFIGRDTRASGHIIEEALTGGLVSAGVRVFSLGCVPTPAISFLTRHQGAVMGLMISASHNPAKYNGVKFFNNMGEKLSLVQEQQISQALIQVDGAMGSGILQSQEPEFLRMYEDFLCQNAPSIAPLRLVVDCAHGAYTDIAPGILAACGVDVIQVLGNQPNGQNINHECGAVFPEKLAAAVAFYQADGGICFDGDGDRVVIVSRDGAVQDGDQMLAALARAEKMRAPEKVLGESAERAPGLHPQKTHFGVVGTVMSNLGLELFLKSQAIPCVRTDVGDRMIGQKLKELQWHLGGEPCGHIILADKLPTGDGLLAGLQLLGHMGTDAHLFPVFDPIPSVVHNIRLRVPNFAQSPKFLEYYTQLQSSLNGDQRVLLRASGTEPVLRILVEGPCKEHVVHLAQSIVHTLDEQQNVFEKVSVS